jgi:hypothetical protein
MKREPTAEEREKIGSAIGGGKAGGKGRGGWSKEVLTPSSGDDVEFAKDVAARKISTTPARFAAEPPLIRPGQELSPGMPEAQGNSETWFFDRQVPQQHFAALDLEAIFWPFSRSSFEGVAHSAAISPQVSPGCDGGIFHRNASPLRVFELPSSAEPLSPHRTAILWVLRRLKNP